MARYWAIAALTFLAATSLTQGGAEKEKEKDKEFKFQGKLTKDDPKDAQRGGPSQVHAVRMKAGKVYTIDMVSTELDSYLRLQDSKGTELAEDDDSGGGLNARIIFNCTADGEYRVVCTTVGPMPGGAYSLTVRTTGIVQAISAAHAKMIGNAAPDFAADFAVNGKPGKLSQLKGKVVLLHFWEVRSSTSAAYLPRFAEWNKAYKGKGLTIVGATFYPSEIGQKLGFDTESGELLTYAEADKKSDQALLKAYAKHHKVDHLLLALPKQTAFDVFDAYTVNGLPQVVLIDRKGMVRLIDVAGEKTSAYVESELKKVLAEK
jgi:hypothetical protein